MLKKHLKVKIVLYTVCLDFLLSWVCNSLMYFMLFLHLKLINLLLWATTFLICLMFSSIDENTATSNLIILSLEDKFLFIWFKRWQWCDSKAC